MLSNPFSISKSKNMNTSPIFKQDIYTEPNENAAIIFEYRGNWYTEGIGENFDQNKLIKEAKSSIHGDIKGIIAELIFSKVKKIDPDVAFEKFNELNVRNIIKQIKFVLLVVIDDYGKLVHYKVRNKLVPAQLKNLDPSFD